MTALNEYDRLEATGLWRASADAQRQNVYVFVGHSSLVIADNAEAPLSHWSLPAIERLNPGQRPALFAPLPDADETLEIDDPTMIEAIERVRHAVRAGEPRPGRLRLAISALLIICVLGLAVFWLPGAVTQHAAGVIPDAQRERLGEQIFTQAQRLTGPPCTAPMSNRDLDVLARAVLPEDPPKLMVVRDGIDGALEIPGRRVILDARLLEDFETADVTAGHLLAVEAARADKDPVTRFLDAIGTWQTLKLLTTGQVADETVSAYATEILRSPPSPANIDTLLTGFGAAGLSTRPYALALKLKGQPYEALLEGDPNADQPTPMMLSDNAWVRLQSICLN